MKVSSDAVRVIDEVLREFGSFDLIVNDAAKKNSVPGAYIYRHRHEYIRTVSDILDRCDRGNSLKVLEIGAFFGVVCIALARLGYSVTAADIEEYMDMPEQIDRFGRNGITRACIMLQDYLLPFEDESFDVIIMCEVLEHLNFNPLPLLKEINRIGKQNSIFYLSQPNLASIHNRLRLLRGNSIQVDVESFFSQLDPTSAAISNGHWREYTMEDIQRLLVPLGFRIEHQYYFSLGETMPVDSPRRLLSRLVYGMFPSFKENLTTIAVRAQRSRIAFHIPSTVHPILHEL